MSQVQPASDPVLLPVPAAAPKLLGDGRVLADMPGLAMRLCVSVGIAAGWAEASVVAVAAASASAEREIFPLLLIPAIFAGAAWTVCLPGALLLSAFLGSIVQTGCRHRGWMAGDRIDALPMSAGALGALLAPLNVPAWTGVFVVGQSEVARGTVIGLAALAIPLAGLVTGYALGAKVRRQTHPDRRPRLPLSFGILHLLALVLAFAVTFWFASTIARWNPLEF